MIFLPLLIDNIVSTVALNMIVKKMVMVLSLSVHAADFILKTHVPSGFQNYVHFDIRKT